ncbi:MAG TPA: hypothetical protein VML94_06505 [Thermoplasmata archaeon]|nr:hypothetical protein [Thermoplasmata archaeon]
MSAPPAPGASRRWSLVVLGVLAGATVLFASASDLPEHLGYLVAALGLGASVALRADAPRTSAAGAVVPILAALTVIAATAPSSAGTDLFGGVAAIALLAWLAEDRRRAPGGLVRAAPSLLVVFVALGIAWTSALFLPTGSARIGFGAALLVLVTILVAYLLGRTDLIDAEPPATA